MLLELRVGASQRGDDAALESVALPLASHVPEIVHLSQGLYPGVEPPLISQGTGESLYKITLCVSIFLRGTVGRTGFLSPLKRLGMQVRLEGHFWHDCPLLFFYPAVSDPKHAAREHAAHHHRQQHQTANTYITPNVPNWTDL